MAFDSSITSNLHSDNVSSCRHTPVNYYAVAGKDSYGEVTVSAAVALLVRIEKELAQIQDPQGRVIATDQLINVDREMSVGSILQVGDSTTYHEIVAYEEVPDISGTKFDRYVRTVRYKDELPTIVT